MKKKVALGIATASAAMIGGWKIVRQMADRGNDTTDAVAVAPGMPAEAFTEPDFEIPGTDAPAPRPEASEAEAASTPPVSKKSTKAELYEIATGLDIEGRSKMTKEQLIEAIEAAS
ncbi:MAG: Rho termination factor N-terminal domain-containing protein [Solirubrobacterales bacterium]